jgi:glycosyltransferase involved in cell wall biosynthesis
LEQRKVIHVPLSEDDALADTQVTPPLAFPVAETFRKPRHQPEAPRDDVRVGFAGRLHQSKGLLTLVEATRLLRSKGVSASLAIAGEGPEKARLAAIASHYRWLSLHEGIADESMLRRFYECLDVFVVASEPAANEGLPVSMLEALLSGARVVATDVGAIRARVGDLVTMVAPGETRSMAEGIIAALSSSRDHGEILSRIPTSSEYARGLLEGLAKPVAGHSA